MLTLERYESGAVTVLRLEGDIDDEGIGALRDGIIGCLEDKRCNVVMNLSNVKFISYMGVGVMVERLRPLRARGGDLKLVGVNLYAERLFRMVGVQSVFDIYPSEAQAIQGYRDARGARCTRGPRRQRLGSGRSHPAP
jgi:anti-sigma B factor antagonist